MRFNLVAATLLGTSTAALGFDHADRTSLGADLQRFAADLEAGRYLAIAERRPPRFPTAPATPEDVKYTDVAFDLDVTDIRTTPTGIDYAVIPTRTAVSTGLGPDKLSDILIFAFQETGRWYFVSLTNEADVTQLQTAYPEFANMDLADPKDTK